MKKKTYLNIILGLTLLWLLLPQAKALAATYYCDPTSNVAITNVSGNIAKGSRFVNSDLTVRGEIVEDINQDSTTMKYSPLMGTLQPGDVIRVNETYNIALEEAIYVRGLIEATYINTGDPAGDYVLREDMHFKEYHWQEGHQLTITSPSNLAGTYTIAAKIDDSTIRLTTQAGDGIASNAVKTDKFLGGAISGFHIGDSIYCNTGATGKVTNAANPLSYSSFGGILFQKGDEIENRWVVATVTSSLPVWNQDGQSITINGTPVANGNNSNDGSAEHPWGTLESAIDAGKFITPIVAGDTVKLNAGFHGSPYFQADYYRTQLNYASDVTIEPNGTAVVECSQVVFKGCKHIRVKGFRISPSLGTPSQVVYHPIYPDAYTIVYTVDSNHLTIEDCNIFTVMDTSQWDPNKWQYWAWTGIRRSDGLESSIIRGNTLRNVWKGIESSSNCLVEDNLIDGFTGDGLKIVGPNSTYQDNTILNHYWSPSGAHVDLMQNNAGNNGDNIIIRRNLLVACTDPNRSEGSVGGVQGIYFEPDANNCLIENNVVMALNQSWGIAIGKGINTRIVNNTVLRPYGKGYWPDIKTGASGNVNLIVRNNIADNFPSGSGITADHNFDISNYDPNVEFVDYAHGNVRLAAGSHFIDAGSSLDAPTEDLERNSRPQGQGYDIGAYEYGASTFLYGDVSENGEISAYDAALTAQYSVGLITLTSEQIKAADVSGNGEVSAYDAALIAQRAVGLIEKFPVEGG